MNDPIYTTDPKAALAAVDSALAAGGEAIGGIQNELANIVDARLAAGANTVRTIKAGLQKTIKKATGLQSSIANGITSTLGEIAGGALAAGATTISALGQAAATGALGNKTRPAQPGEEGWRVVWGCDQFGTRQNAQLLPPGVPLPAGMFASDPFKSSREASDWMVSPAGQAKQNEFCTSGMRQQQPAKPPSVPASEPGPTKTVWVPVVRKAYPHDAGADPWAPQVEGGWQTTPEWCGSSQFATEKKADAIAYAASHVDELLAICFTPLPDIPTETPPPVEMLPTGDVAPPEPVEMLPANLPQEAAATPQEIVEQALTEFPALNCVSLVNGQLPPLGSVEWCACVDGLLQWFDAIGRWAANALLPESMGGGKPQGYLDALKGVSGGLAGKILPSDLFAKPVEAAIADLNEFQDAWRIAVTQFALVTSAKLVGLTVCRTVLKILRHLRFGWDVGIWATIDIDIALNPIEKLLDYIENYAFQWEIPSPEIAMECYLQHTAPEGQIRCWMAVHGHNLDTYMPAIDARRDKLSPEELIQLGRRNDISDEVLADQLTLQGWHRLGEAKAKLELFDELPTINDHLHWLQRNVFDVSYVEDFNLLDGFDSDEGIHELPDFGNYEQKFPLGRSTFWSSFGHDLRALGMKKEYAAKHYAAHWIIPSFGTLAEAKQRLRPGRVAADIQVTSDDYMRMLAEQDVAPWWRARLEAISYRTLPLRQLNAAAQQGRFDENELSQRWQDIGFTVVDSVVMAKTSLVSAARTTASAGHGFTAALISDLAQFDLIDKESANTYLGPQGFTADQVDTLFKAAAKKRLLTERKRHEEASLNDYAKLAAKAYGEGAVSRDKAFDALSNAGYSKEAATLELFTVDLKTRMETVSVAVKQIRTGYIHGEVDSAGAANLLRLAGVSDPMITEYTARWSLEMNVRRISASAGAIIRWAKNGLISIANAEARLANLGWTADTIRLSLMEIEQTITRAKQQAAERTQAALAAAQRTAKAAVKQTQARYCKLYSPSKMVRWYATHVIDESTFRARLDKCGYDAEGIERLFREATIAREAKDAKATAKGDTGVIYAGPGADPGPAAT